MDALGQDMGRSKLQLRSAFPDISRSNRLHFLMQNNAITWERLKYKGKKKR